MTDRAEEPVLAQLRRARYSAGMTVTRMVLLIMAVMVVVIVARTLFGGRR